MATLKEAVKAAVESGDLARIGRLVDRLRNRGHKGVTFNYCGMALLFSRCAGITVDEFEALMWEVDHHQTADVLTYRPVL